MTDQKRSGIGIKLNEDTPKAPYFTFADDYIIFYRTIKVTTRNIKQILDHYYMVSSQIVI